MSSTPQPPDLNGKSLGRYKDLGRGPVTSYYRRVVASAGPPPDAGTLRRLEAFNKSVRNWIRWASHVIRYMLSRRHPFQKYPPGGGIYRADEKLCLSIAGDWGTGTDEALEVTNRMAAHKPDYTIHLGDVYYVGDLPELNVHCLGVSTQKHKGVKWQPGTRGSFALCGNHEMYACGDAYYRNFLPTLGPDGRGQGASYFCLRNDRWRIIGLDTGYNSLGILGIFSRFGEIKSFKAFRKMSQFKPSCELPLQIMHWLTRDVMLPNPDGTQPATILLSHHQYYSGFDDWYTKPAQQLKRYFNHQPVLWFWGHEHRFAVYDKFKVARGIEAYGRCVGHGGMPVDRGSPDILDCRCLFYDNRPYRNGEEIDVGYNGFVDLCFDGPKLLVNYYDLKDTLLLTEQWFSDAQGNLSGPIFSNIYPGLTSALG
jgi:hypothetical protein